MHKDDYQALKWVDHDHHWLALALDFRKTDRVEQAESQEEDQPKQYSLLPFGMSLLHRA